jgi:hypothetical protein
MKDLGPKKFDFPKDADILAELLGLVGKTNMVIYIDGMLFKYPIIR